MTKKFYHTWTDEEIKEYTDQFNVLVLFVVQLGSNEAKICIYGNLDDSQKDKLMENIVTMFGGTQLSDPLCGKINEYAEKWYNKFILKKKARVINYRKGKR